MPALSNLMPVQKFNIVVITSHHHHHHHQHQRQHHHHPPPHLNVKHDPTSFVPWFRTPQIGERSPRIFDPPSDDGDADNDDFGDDGSDDGNGDKTDDNDNV